MWLKLLCVPMLTSTASESGVCESERAAFYKQITPDQRLATVLVSHTVCGRFYGQGNHRQ